MSPPNGHAREKDATTTMPGPPATVISMPGTSYSAERVKELVAALEVPFDPSQIEWRVMNTTRGQQPGRGQVVPYADQRAYTDRLNERSRQRGGRASTRFIPAPISSGAKIRKLSRRFWSLAS